MPDIDRLELLRRKKRLKELRVLSVQKSKDEKKAFFDDVQCID